MMRRRPTRIRPGWRLFKILHLLAAIKVKRLMSYFSVPSIVVGLLAIFAAVPVFAPHVAHRAIAFGLGSSQAIENAP